MLIGGEDAREKLWCFAERFSLSSTRIYGQMLEILEQQLQQQCEMMLCQLGDDHGLAEADYEIRPDENWHRSREHNDAQRLSGEDEGDAANLSEAAMDFSLLLSGTDEGVVKELMDWYIQQAKAVHQLHHDREQAIETMQSLHIEAMENVTNKEGDDNEGDSAEALHDLVRKHIAEGEKTESFWRNRIEELKAKQRMELQDMMSTRFQTQRSVVHRSAFVQRRLHKESFFSPGFLKTAPGTSVPTPSEVGTSKNIFITEYLYVYFIFLI